MYTKRQTEISTADHPPYPPLIIFPAAGGFVPE
jgi:hypothetical protein